MLCVQHTVHEDHSPCHGKSTSGFLKCEYMKSRLSNLDLYLFIFDLILVGLCFLFIFSLCCAKSWEITSAEKPRHYCWGFVFGFSNVLMKEVKRAGKMMSRYGGTNTDNLWEWRLTIQRQKSKIILPFWSSICTINSFLGARPLQTCLAELIAPTY